MRPECRSVRAARGGWAWLLAFAIANLGAGMARAVTITVTNAADAGTGSLRAAITASNTLLTSDTIVFAIPGAGVHTIAPLTPLPTITDGVLIDGYSQPGALPNTLLEADDAVILVAIDGGSGGASDSAFAICAGDVTVRGLAITNFGSSGITIGATSGGTLCGGVRDNVVVAGNFIGLAPDGSTGAGNGTGIRVGTATNTRIGGTTPSERNVISANDTGVFVTDSTTTGTTILGNYFGTDRSGRLDRGNAAFGISLANEVPATVIGGSPPNRIAFNGLGIVVRATVVGANLALNEFVDNNGLAIDLVASGSQPDGVTPNDLNDADAGANNLQNFPVITQASRRAGGLHVEGTLDRPAGATIRTYSITVYAGDSCDPSGFGEGERPLGSQLFISPNGTIESFAFDFAGAPLALGTAITATARDSSGDTSELSACAPVTEDPAALVVSKTADTNDGACNADCSLREALVAANANADASIVRFNIPGAGPHTLAPTGALPTLTNPVLIDGYTEPGSVANSSPTASNAVLQIRLDGGSAGNASGLVADSAGVTVRGLSITGFALAGFATLDEAVGAALEGCFVGLLPSGAAAGNVFDGVDIPDGTAVRIGGAAPAQRNVISANSSAPSNIGGVRVVNSGTTAIIDGNLIGTDPSGAFARANFGPGISIGTGAATVGEQAPNRVAFNTRNGIEISGATLGNAVAGNDVFGNASAGIDLGLNGPTPNDPDDADSGPNGLQNFPVLGRVAAFAGVLEVDGVLDVPAATPGSGFRIAVYENSACDGNGNGEGELLLGTVRVELSGAAEGFHIELADAPAIGAIVTATATDPAGNTSEFSACSVVTDGNVLLRSGFENDE